MKQAFTLIELLVVVGIMGLMGTVSVGGYRAMQRGMEERGVMQNVNALVKAAFERAQIDRQPAAIYYWNETLRAENTQRDETEIVVGHAVAVRPLGRISLVSGQTLVDEFNDLERMFPIGGEEASGGSGPQGNNKGGQQSQNQNSVMYLYCLDSLASGTKPERSLVSSAVVAESFTEVFMQLGNPPSDNVGSGETVTYGFNLVDKMNANWKVGSAYGMEFAELTLPKNYIFGRNYSKSLSNPVDGEGAVVYKVGVNSGSGVFGNSAESIDVYAIRPGKSGRLEAQKVGTSDNPTSSN